MNIREFFKKLKKIRLEKDEKQRVRDNLVIFMEQNPVRNREVARPVFYGSNIINQLRLFNLKPTMTIMLIIALLVGGGASASAEGALPGEILYPIKVAVNEQVVGWLSFSEEAKAKWEAKIAGRRLEEAEELSSKQRLDADAKTEIEARFKAHADRVAVGIDKLEAEENFEAASEVASNFEVSLRAHEKILKMFVEQGHNGKVRDIALKVGIEAGETEDRRAEIELKLTRDPNIERAARGKLKEAENKLAEVKRFFESKKSMLTAEDIVKAEAELRISSDLIAQGKVKLEAKAYAEAFSLFQKAHRTAQSVKVMIEAKEAEEDDERRRRGQDVEGSIEVKTRTEAESVSPAKARSRTEVELNF